MEPARMQDYWASVLPPLNELLKDPSRAKEIAKIAQADSTAEGPEAPAQPKAAKRQRTEPQEEDAVDDVINDDFELGKVLRRGRRSAVDPEGTVLELQFFVSDLSAATHPTPGGWTYTLMDAIAHALRHSPPAEDACMLFDRAVSTAQEKLLPGSKCGRGRDATVCGKPLSACKCFDARLSRATVIPASAHNILQTGPGFLLRTLCCPQPPPRKK